MAHVVTSPAQVSPGSAPGSFLTAMRDSLRRYRAYRATRSELMALSDHDLQDIGLNRSMIERVALDAAFQRQA